MSRVLIAERQTLVRKMLRTLLLGCAEFDDAVEASDGNEVIELLRRYAIDTLVMDMSLPGISGIDLISRCLAIHPKLIILVLSMHPDPQMVTQILKSGAHGYISTMHSPDEFISAVCKINSGARYIDPAIAEAILLYTISGEDAPVHVRLSQRELEIYRLLVSGRNITQIADQLIISNKTVSSHKKNLMQKMHFSSMADLMRYAVQHRLFEDIPATF